MRRARETGQGTCMTYSLEVNSAVEFLNRGTIDILRCRILCCGELLCALLRSSEVPDEEKA